VQTLNNDIKSGFHRLAADERPGLFSPAFWATRDGDIQHVFAGCHSDVGRDILIADFPTLLSNGRWASSRQSAAPAIETCWTLRSLQKRWIYARRCRDIPVCAHAAQRRTLLLSRVRRKAFSTSPALSD
jgi:hypothetical protein